MHWESLNEYLEESFRAGFIAGNEFRKLSDDEIDTFYIGCYIKYLDEIFHNREKQRYA